MSPPFVKGGLGGIFLKPSLNSTALGGGVGSQSLICTLQFSISDTGAGIAPEDMDHLFEAFAQTETGHQAQEGTGLGLPISRKFVQLMGGDITATSEIGHGTTFRCDIQATIVDDTGIEKTPPTRPAIALEPGQPRYRVLIVDDKPDNRALLFKLLTPFGFELQEATNGQEAVDIWKAWTPHLIWMDLRMPVMGGYDATQQIRAQLNGKDTIIIVLSASSVEDERTAALSHGCHDFLRKPFHESEVFDLMQRHLGVRFVYEEEKKLTISNPFDYAQDRLQSTIETVLTPAALTTLPAEWLDILKQGARRADFLLLSNVIEEIRVQDARLADALTQLAEDFEYDQILNLIEGTHNAV